MIRLNRRINKFLISTICSIVYIGSFCFIQEMETYNWISWTAMSVCAAIGGTALCTACVFFGLIFFD